VNIKLLFDVIFLYFFVDYWRRRWIICR